MSVPHQLLFASGVVLHSVNLGPYKNIGVHMLSPKLDTSGSPEILSDLPAQIQKDVTVKV